METANGSITWEQLNMLRPAVYRRCLSLLKHPDNAEDAAQRTLLRAFEKRDTFRNQSSLSTWVLRIALNLCLNDLKGEKATFQLPEDLHCNSAACRLNDAEQTVTYWEIVRETHRKGKCSKPRWNHLDFRIWKAIVERAWNGESISWREIGQAVQSAESTVKYRVHHHIAPVFEAVYFREIPTSVSRGHTRIDT